MYFCSDTDLLTCETAPFLDTAFANQRLLSTVTATLTSTALAFSSAVLAAAGVLPGMVAIITSSDNTQQVLASITAITDASNATVSVLPARDGDPAVAPFVSGSVKVSVITFRPQIAAVGDELLGAIGIASDGATATPSPASANLQGFRIAAVYGTLSRLYRTLLSGRAAAVTVTLASGASAVADPNLTKMNLYRALYDAARKTLSALVDEDSDNTPETLVRAGTIRLERA